MLHQVLPTEKNHLKNINPKIFRQTKKVEYFWYKAPKKWLKERERVKGMRVL